MAGGGWSTRLRQIAIRKCRGSTRDHQTGPNLARRGREAGVGRRDMRFPYVCRVRAGSAQPYVGANVRHLFDGKSDYGEWQR